MTVVNVLSKNKKSMQERETNKLYSSFIFNVHLKFEEQQNNHQIIIDHLLYPIVLSFRCTKKYKKEKNKQKNIENKLNKKQAKN